MTASTGNAWLVLALLLAACGAPAGRGEAGGDEEEETSGDDGESEAGDVGSIDDGSWAPRASLARLEDVPRRGKVEERPSRTGAVRLVGFLPVDGTGNHVVEIVGLPALDRDVVVASLRASHAQPQWVGCNELAFVGDGVAQRVDDARHEGGVTPLGVQEAIQGRIPVARLEAAAGAGALVVKSCENEYAVEGGPALLGEFVRRFGELTAGPAPDDAGEGGEAEDPALEDAAGEGPR